MDLNPTTSPPRPKRRASLGSLSLIKNLASSGSRSKRRTVIESSATTTSSPIASRLDTPKKLVEKGGQSLARNLDPALFPPDLGINFKVGSTVYAKDGYGKWCLGRILEIRYDIGHVLVHFEYWSQKHDEWIAVSGGRLRAADSGERPHSGELLQVGDFVFARWADKGDIYPAQIIEAFENDEFNLLYYDGFEKIALRRTLKKMSDAEVKELDLVHFGRLKTLPTFPNNSFSPDLTDKYGGKRRCRAAATATSSEWSGVVALPSASPTTSTAATASVDARPISGKFVPQKTDVVGDSSLVENSDADDVIIEKKSLKTLPQRPHAPRRTRKHTYATGLLQFLTNLKLIPKEPDYRCRQCGGPLKLSVVAQSADGWVWHCSNYTTKNKQEGRACDRRVSIRRFTFFEHSKLSISDILKFAHFWLLDFTLDAIGAELAMASYTLVRWSSRCEEVLLRSMLENSAPLGGPGRVVEIKGVEYKRRKYDSDYLVDGVWAYGGYERGSGRIFLVPVIEKSSADFVAFTKEWLLPGTTVISDKRPECDGKKRRRLKENYNITFKNCDTDTKNTFEESTKNPSKTGLYGSRSRKPHRTAGNLAKYMFIERCNELGLNRETEFLKLAAHLYNPLSMRDVRSPAYEKDEQEET